MSKSLYPVIGMSDESSDDSFVSADEGSDFEAETVPMPPKVPFSPHFIPLVFFVLNKTIF